MYLSLILRVFCFEVSLGYVFKFFPYDHGSETGIRASPPGIVLCGAAMSFVSSGSGWMLVIETAWHLRDGALHVGFFLPSLG